jgi:sugar phosphate isomerase/epimerase
MLLTNTDASKVDFELDIYWAVKAGGDPMALIEKYPKRFTCCHVKDAGPAPQRAMLDVGAGTIDFKSILARARKLAMQHWFIEHDNPKDAIASVTASAAAMKKM